MEELVGEEPQAVRRPGGSRLDPVPMIFDTDIIWVQRGNKKAAGWIDRTEKRFLPVYSYMELLQSAANKRQHEVVDDFLSAFDFVVLPLTENIGHRALVYIEEYSLSHGLRAGDAIIAATAIENGMTLVSGNRKHLRPIRDLKFKVFVPSPRGTGYSRSSRSTG